MKHIFIKIICAILTLLFTIQPLNYTQDDDEINYIISEQSHLGDAGRLFIPALHINVALYDDSIYTINGQLIVDKQDSAAWCKSFLGGCGYIADHSSQSFATLKDCQVGYLAYIKTNKDILIYQCIYVTTGRHHEGYLTEQYGINIKDIHWADFVCYTCNTSWRDIYMVFFKYIGAISI